MYYWHRRPCKVLTEPIYAKGIKRNCLIQTLDTDEKIIVPRRALRKEVRPCQAT